MKIKLDPPFTLFIGDIRKLDKETQEKRIRTEIRRITSAKTNNVLEQYTNVLKLVYFGIHGYDVDEMVFIKAAESNDACVKQIGYLGLSIIKDKSLLILTVNTVMKDLRHSCSRKFALNFIGNLDNGQIYLELSSLISANTNNDANAVKSIVAKNVLSNLQRFSIVGNDESLLYTKVQIILEKLNNNMEFSLSENEILFFISLYMCTKSRFLKVKLVELYAYFQQKGLLNVSQNFRK